MGTVSNIDTRGGPGLTGTPLATAATRDFIALGVQGDGAGGSDGVLRDSSGAVATRSAIGNKIAILGNSIVAQNAQPNFGALTGWAASASKSLTNTVIPIHMVLTSHWAHFYYTCVQAGTTGTIEPIWPLDIGGTVTDGTVVWEATGYRTDVPQWGSGYFVLAQALSGQRLEEVYIGGRSGAQSPAILDYVDIALSCDPDIVYFANLFENDVWPGAAPVLSTITANWDSAVIEFERVRALGKKLILNTVLPSGNIDASSAFTSYVSGTGTKAYQWLNNKIREYAAGNVLDVILFDCANLYVDANPANPVWPENTVTYLSAAGAGQALKKTDAIHPYVSARYILAKALAEVITSNFPEVNRYRLAVDAQATSPNPLNYGTAGTAGAGITSGTPANLMTATAFGTVTAAVLSKVARTDQAGEWQKCTYVATAGDNPAYNATAVDNIGVHFAIGDIVQAFAEIKIEANPTLHTYAQAQLRFFGGTPQWLYSPSQSSADQDMGQMITTDTVFHYKTLPMKVSPGTTSLLLYNKAFARGATNMAVQFGRMAVVKAAIAALE